MDYCSFADRCPWAEPACREGEPPLEPLSTGSDHRTSCIRSDEMKELASEYLTDTERDTADSRPVPEQTGTTSGGGPGTDTPRLELRNLSKHFDQSSNILELIKRRFGAGEESPVRAVDGVDLTLRENEVQGIIGESGCGKSTLLSTVMGLHEPTSGELRINGTDVSELDDSDWKEIKQDVQIIFQDPFNTMNPQFTVREALREPLNIHDMDSSDSRLLDMLDRVHLTPPEEYIGRKESQLSGGEKQRVAIARALLLEPEIILADEPVSMLDVSTQASVLRLLRDLADDFDVSMLYVSHDLSTVSYICDRVNVMYLGRIIESGPTMEILSDPKHPYTQALRSAVPIPDPYHDRDWAQLSGTPGDVTDIPDGCRFKDRCPERMDICDERPVFRAVDGDVDHQTACHLYYDHESITADRPLQEVDH